MKFPPDPALYELIPIAASALLDVPLFSAEVAPTKALESVEADVVLLELENALLVAVDQLMQLPKADPVIHNQRSEQAIDTARRV